MMLKLIASSLAAFQVQVHGAGEYWKKEQMVDKMKQSIDDFPAVFEGYNKIISDYEHSCCNHKNSERWQYAKNFRNTLVKQYRTTISQARNKVKTIYLESLDKNNEKDMWNAMVAGRNALNSAYGQLKWKHIKLLDTPEKEQAYLANIMNKLETVTTNLKYTKARGGI